MPTTRKRSSAAAAVTKSAIAEASTLLKELPEKPKNNWSLREAVSLLQESITEALDRGYTYEEVAVLLGKQGVSIAAPSLKRYLAAVKRDKGSTRRGGRGKSNKAALEASDLASVVTSLEKAPVAKKAPAAEKAAPASKGQSKTSGRTAAKAEPKAAAKKAKATPTATAKTTAATPAAAKTTTRGRKKSAS